MFRRSLLIALCYSVSLAAGVGCQANRPKVAPAEPPVVPVSQPVQREVTDYVDFTGRTEAVQSVDIRPRVTGYLVKMPFQEGAEVKAGDLLFVIDPRPYQAQLDQAQGQVDLYQASLKLARTTLRPRPGDQLACRPARQPAAVRPGPGRRSTRPRPGSRRTRRAWRSTGSTSSSPRSISPIDGQISRYYLTLGNLVNQDQTLLTTVVSVDPMYVYFDMDEPTLLRIRKAINEGKIKLPEDGTTMPVLMGLQGEDGLPAPGDDQLRQQPGQPHHRQHPGARRLSQPAARRGATGCCRRACSCGSACRSASPTRPCWSSTGPSASDQGLKYVYVLDADNKVQYRRVTTGPLQDDGLRVIEQGLKPDDWVVVGGLQQVRPRMTVRPERVPMPTLGPADRAASATGRARHREPKSSKRRHRRVRSEAQHRRRPNPPSRPPSPPEPTKR